ncbi:MAG: protein phosphatase 2C domain-containing protein [Bacteroidales bacterium]|jgi:serine/threonine protein phosphatase PrpC|nr:protein phosphatase 2C domain-containing protein [Bacteroidales bacterium]
MDLKKIIVDASEDRIEDFRSKNQSQIETFILDLWKEYQQNSDPVEIDQGPVIDLADDGDDRQCGEYQPNDPENPDEPGSPDEINVNETEMQKQGASERPPYDAIDLQIKSRHIALPNGKVNQNYDIHFDIEKIIPEISGIRFEGLDQAGLQFVPETKKITGIPQAAGDYKIKMYCRRHDWEEGKPTIEREITLIINPDPRSLWVDLPTPEDIEYYKPDCNREFIKVEASETVARKDMVAASKRGRSHAHEGKPRDDDFMLHFDDGSGWYVMAVADGAGSARYSREGSRIACRTAVDTCITEIKNRGETFEKQIRTFSNVRSEENRKQAGDTLYHIIGTAAFKSHKDIEKEAVDKGNPIKDYATTLILSICKKFDFGWFVGAFWVGDGGIGIYAKEPPFLKVLGEADGGEFAGQTRFLTMTEIVQPMELYRRLRFDIVDDFTALILMTDGVTDPKFETDANLNRIEKWHDFWNNLSQEVDFSDDHENSAEQLLKWLDFWSPGNHDDRTIAILF